MGDRVLYPPILGNFEPDYSGSPVSRHIEIKHSRESYPPLINLDENETSREELPSILRILNHYFQETQARDNDPISHPFLNHVNLLHDVDFIAKHPVLSMGHNFSVWAAPFDSSEQEYKAVDGRAINPQVYCLKTPNFSSGRSRDAAGGKWRKEYCDTTLRELRVLLHPQLRSCENIISLLGLDFHEDHDDYTVTWPVLMLEYADFGTLETLQEDIYVGPELSRILLLDVARGLQALHDCNIIHGDVRSENVLICRHHDRKYIARLSGLGVSIINPDVTKHDHRLLGGASLWNSPEADQSMSVDGLKSTDVYSFGLMAWRVFRHHHNPYELLPLERLGTQSPTNLQDTVMISKTHQDFQRMVLDSMVAQKDTPQFFHLIVESALGREPASRSLEQTISALSQDLISINPSIKIESSENYWATEEPPLILKQVQDRYPEKLLPYNLKPAILFSLASALDSLFQSGADLALEAGWLLWNLSSDQQFPLLKRDEDECCRMLVQLSKLKSAKARAITTQYHVMNSMPTQALDVQWLEEAASDGSFYAKESLRTLYPDRFPRLMSRPLYFEYFSTDTKFIESELLRAVRTGDYEACNFVLRSSTSIPVQKSGVSPFHWLVSFRDETQIEYLVASFLRKGIPPGLWEGDTEDDIVFGKVVGTPLCWAVWHRNLPLIRVLLGVLDEIKVEVFNRLLNLAAGMHFYDVLDVIKASKIQILNGAKPNWQIPLHCAGDVNEFQLARRLRHEPGNTTQALERTLDVLLTMYKPTKEDVKILFRLAFCKNSPPLMQYLFDKMDLEKRKDLLRDPAVDFVLGTVGPGYKEVFDICIARGLIHSGLEHSDLKLKPLQICCSSRQRDPYFAQRLVEIGCPVEEFGPAKDAVWTPFANAVFSGRYEVATALLELGANKDAIYGLLGGATVTMNLLQSWPDIPLSRLKYLFEEVPRLGFGHVAFWGWPETGGNILYALAMSHWSFYANDNRLEETAKYILSRVADKGCINRPDKFERTALRVACTFGNLEICRALIEAGQDVNMSSGATPLSDALEWRDKSRKAEEKTLANKDGSGRVAKRAQTLRTRAEKIVDLLIVHGAVSKGVTDDLPTTGECWNNSGRQLSTYATPFELLSSLTDPLKSLNPRTTTPNPTSSNDSRTHLSNTTWIKKRISNIGKRMDGGGKSSSVAPRYAHHNCLPYKECGGFSSPEPTYKQPQTRRPSRPASVSTLSSGSVGSRISISTVSTSMTFLRTSSSSPPIENKRKSLPPPKIKPLSFSKQNRSSVPVFIPPPSHYGPSPIPQPAMPMIAELEAEPVVRPKISESFSEPQLQGALPPIMPGISNMVATGNIPPHPRRCDGPELQGIPPIMPGITNMVAIGNIPPRPVSYREPWMESPQPTPPPLFPPSRQQQNHTPVPMEQQYAPGPVYPQVPVLRYAALPIRQPSAIYQQPQQPRFQTQTPFPPQSEHHPYPYPYAQSPQQPVHQPPTLQPQALAPLVQEIQNVLLLYFLEGSPATSTTAYIPPTSTLSIPARKTHAINILQHQLRAPVILARPCVDLELGECAEFEELKTVVERCVESMGIGGCVSLVPELGAGGGLLGVHVFEN